MWNRLVLLGILLVSLVHAADDGWGKVKSLPNGAEVRVTKHGVRFGIVGHVYDVTDESIIVTTKNEQISIAKEEIVKIDSHPYESAARSTKSSSGDHAAGSRRTVTPIPRPNRSGVKNQDWDLVWSRPAPKPN